MIRKILAAFLFIALTFAGFKIVNSASNAVMLPAYAADPFSMIYNNGKNLKGANLSRAELEHVDLSGANLEGANLKWADLSEADLRGANLRGANLFKADLDEADLRGADLTGANLSWADLEEANLRGAKIQGAKFKWADLEHTIWVDGRMCSRNSRSICR